MKKTIAILLVLVLAGVGLFAATADNTLTIKTAIDSYNLMKITDAATINAPTTTTLFNEATFGGVSYDYAPVIALNTETYVANLHTMSNNRAGYSVSMTAGALTTALSEPTKPVTHLSYTVNAYNGATVYSSVSTAAADKASSTVTVAEDIIVSGPLTKKQINSRAIKVLIASDDDALAATYNGTITFAYTAN